MQNRNKPEEYYSTLKLGLWLISGLFFLTVISFLGYLKIDSYFKENLGNQLKATLNTNIEAVDLWWKDKIRDAQVLAEGQQVRNHVLSLINKTKGEKWTKDQVLQTPEAIFLRKQLGKAAKNYGFIGFVLFDRDAYQVLALLDEATGTRLIVEKKDFPLRAIEGQSVVTTPFTSEIPLPDADGVVHSSFPTMFVAVPVRDDEGKVVAALSFRIRPEIEFNRLMTISRFGESGETYSFNQQGTLLTESRFNNDLITVGLISPEPGQMSMLQVEIRDPGVNLLEGFITDVPRDKQPLTRMANSAVSGENKTNTDGYNDYRGVPVVGAWAWLDDKGFGITTEVDVEEAFTPLRTLEILFFSLFSLLSITLVLSTFIFLIRSRSKKRLKEQQELTDQKDRMLGTLADTIADAVITIDQGGIIQSFNPAAEKIFGYLAEEVVGQNVKILMEGENHVHHDEYLRRYLEFRVPHIIGIGREVIGVKKDGTHFDLELSVSQFKVGQETWFTGICRDISERKQHEKEMKSARTEAEAANKAKTQFLARMSHELRTPLNAILGFGQLLELDGSIAQNQKKSVNQILKSGHHLLDLINDILDLSRIETDDFQLSLDPLDLPPLVQEMITLTQTLALNNKVKLINELPETLPYRMTGDLTRTKQILLNLVNNAIKYNCKNGSVILSCGKVDDQFVEISVTDTGPGISPDEIHNLFVPFERLGADNSVIEGTGIGLAISLDLARKMNGDILVESKPGQGSRFTLRLPLSENGNPSIKPYKGNVLNEPAFSLQACQATILYIEDNPSNLDLVSQIIKRYDHLNLISAATGREGLQAALRAKPDLILLDIDLPDINGLDLFNQLQSLQNTCDIPVLGLSANALDEEIKKALKLGLKDYITKPIDISTFLKKLFQHLPVAK